MAHHHTILGQMLQMFSRFQFQKAVKQTNTECHAHGFSSWTLISSPCSSANSQARIVCEGLKPASPSRQRPSIMPG